ncbi:MAG: response regulator, partial [Desulfocucumaceae bacterium]
MFSEKPGGREGDVLIVDKSQLMRNTLKSMIINNDYVIHEASDEVIALNLAIKHNPKIFFVSMEDNNYWPGLVRHLKIKDSKCTVIAYSTDITKSAVAIAYFAGVDDILISPQNQRERIEKYIAREEGISSDRYYKF